jgi:hypothetical protein
MGKKTNKSQNFTRKFWVVVAIITALAAATMFILKMVGVADFEIVKNIEIGITPTTICIVLLVLTAISIIERLLTK